jgi:hypothetical protein
MQGVRISQCGSACFGALFEPTDEIRARCARSVDRPHDPCQRCRSVPPLAEALPRCNGQGERCVQWRRLWRCAGSAPMAGGRLAGALATSEKKLRSGVKRRVEGRGDRLFSLPCQDCRVSGAAFVCPMPLARIRPWDAPYPPEERGGGGQPPPAVLARSGDRWTLRLLFRDGGGGALDDGFLSRRLCLLAVGWGGRHP